MSIVNFLGQPEGKTFEYKRDLSSPKPLLKTLVAFANSAGGQVVIGMADDKTVLGISQPLELGMRLRLIVPFAQVLPTPVQVLKQGAQSEEGSDQVAGQVAGQVADLLRVCINEMSRKELMQALGLAGRDNFEKLYLQPALKQGLIARTIPDKPNSRLQKYTLTNEGKRVMEATK